MPSPSMIEAFDAAQERYAAAVAHLVPLLLEMAMQSVAEVLPGADGLETHGERTSSSSWPASGDRWRARIVRRRRR